MKVFVVVFVALAAICIAQQPAPGSWEYVDQDYATFALGLSFQTEQAGWIAGGTAAATPLLMHTTNGGLNLTNTPLSGASNAAFLSIGMASGTRGVAGAFGFLGLFACGAYTLNGTAWQVAPLGADFICLGLSSSATSDGTFVIIGSWAELTDFDGSGIQISTNSGNSFKLVKWGGATTDPVIGPECGWFANANTGYVSGGVDPESSVTDMKTIASLVKDNKPFNISRKFAWDGTKVVPRKVPTNRAQDVSGYAGLVQKYSNGVFQTVYNTTNDGMSIGDISCSDVNTCWFVGFGVNRTTGSDATWVYKTVNGGQSWNVVFYQQNASFSTITALNSTYVWVGGVVENGNNIDGTFWLTTNGGTTWSPSTMIKKFAPFQISVVDQNKSYCGGVNEVGLSSLVTYTS